jgi:hypothetical protein
MPRPASGAVVERQRKRGRVFALRFRAAGERQFETLGSEDEGWTSSRAEEELKNRLAQVRLGVWQPPRQEPVPIVDEAEPIFWEFARGWLERREHEVDARTVEHWEWALNTHLREPFGRMVLSAIDVQTVDAFKAAKVRERHTLDEKRRKGEKVTERRR